MNNSLFFANFLRIFDDFSKWIFPRFFTAASLSNPQFLTNVRRTGYFICYGNWDFFHLLVNVKSCFSSISSILNCDTSCIFLWISKNGDIPSHAQKPCCTNFWPDLLRNKFVSNSKMKIKIKSVQKTSSVMMVQAESIHRSLKRKGQSTIYMYTP